MPFTGDLVAVKVRWIGTGAFIEVVNRRGRLVELIVEGPPAGPRLLRVAGNDSLSVVYVASELKVRYADEGGGTLYEGRAPEVAP